MKRIYLLFILLCLFPFFSKAQKYPVSINARLQKPYSVYLSDYTIPGEERLSATVLLKDTQEPFYDIRLRFTLKGAGIQIESKPDLAVPPITLQAGIPLILRNADFADYLNPKNLIFKGITRQQFEKTGGIPEGLYEISWQVYDYRRTDVSLSNKAITTAWIVLNNPPLLNTPLADEKLTPRDPQNIRFSWQQNGAFLNGGFTTEYTLALYEVREEGRNPNEIVRGSKPVATLVTQNTSITYGPAEPALIPGMRYAYRLKARDIQGRELYNNSGYSEVRTFTYGDACQLPAEVVVQETSAQWAAFSWENAPTATQYLLRYRQADDPDAAWFEEETWISSRKITTLRPDTRYEYQVKCRCGSFDSEYTKTGTFTTEGATDESKTINCSPATLNALALDGSTVLPSARPGSMFKAGHFPVKVTEVSGGAGMFTGKGELFVPFLATTLKVSFQDISVNAEGQIIRGNVMADFVDEHSLSSATINKINSFQPEHGEICVQYNEDGYDAEGYDKKGYDKEGYDRQGYNTEGYDREGYDQEGFGKDGYDRPGYDSEGFNEEGFNPEGVDRNGLDKAGNQAGSSSSSTNSKGGNGGGNNILAESISEHDLEKIIKKYLKSLKKQYEDSIRVQRKQVETFSQELETIIANASFDRGSIIGLDDGGIGEDMSKYVEAHEVPGSPSPDPAYHMRIVRKEVYDQDVKLRDSKAKQAIIEEYQNDVPHVAAKVREAMQGVSEEQANTLTEDKSAMNQWTHQQVDTLIAIAAESEGSSRMSEGNVPSFAHHSDAVSTATAYAEMPTNTLPFGRYDGLTSRSLSVPPPGIDPKINKAYLLHQIIQDENRKRGQYSMEEAMDLPMGIGKIIGNIEYLISIGSMTFTPTAAYMDVYMGAEVPWSGNWLTFQGQSIEIFPEGFGGDYNRLLLAQDVPIRLNNNMRLTIKGSEERTFIDWDCQGFREMNVQGEVEFCPGILIPDQKTGEHAAETVKARFETSFQEWGEFIAQVSIDPFQVKGLKDFTFEVKHAYADFSDLYNPTGIVFPADYSSAYLMAGTTGLWQGFYLQETVVKLPAKLDNDGHNSSRKQIYAENLIIDEQGVSGIFSASGLIPDGSLNGWSYSVDKLSIQLIKNKLKAGGMEGTITLPIMEEKDTLGYIASIDAEGKWLFNVHLEEKMDIPLWRAKMEVAPSSFIEIRERDNQFIPRAVLNGKVDIEAPLGKKANLSLSGIQFQQLTLSSERPYFQPGIWSLNEIGVNDHAAGFSLTLTGIEWLNPHENEMNIQFDATLSLMEDRIAATTQLNMQGHLEEEEHGRQIWQYDQTKIHRISVDTDGDAVDIHGELQLFESDPVYGNGFTGFVQATFNKSFTLSAKAQFGKVNSTRYWYVDAMVKINKGLDIAGTGLAIYGFGGGAYHHMRRQRVDQVNLASADENLPGGLEVNTSPSGIYYIPDESVHLGVKAAVAFGTTGDPRPFNGDVAFEMSFYKGGGVAQAGFSGNGYFMSELTTGMPRPSVPLYAGVDISYDFQNRVLHGNCKVYVNMAGGLIRGRNAGNLAGEAVLHFDPDDWYIHIGKPSSRIGLLLSVPIKQLPIGVDMSSYLMIGTQLEPMPEPPAKVIETLQRPYDAGRDPVNLATGKGFAFGADFSINTGKLQVAMFYGQLEAGTGFDMMLANYGKNAACAGRSGAMGINGWYAQGQAYAYLEGSIGIRVKVFKVKVEEEILRIGAAALVQAKLPNPFWLSGEVGGYYSLLGGKVSGKCHFGFEVGQQCQIQLNEQPGEESLVEGITAISELTPVRGKQQVDVFTAPQAVFNIPVNEAFTLVDTLSDKQQAFRVRMDHFKVMDGKREIAGTYEWNEQNDVVAFNSHDILPGNQDLTMVAQVSFEEKKGGLWEAVRTNGQKAVETLEQTFTTGEAPDYIPENNVKYSYPIHRQMYFLPKEHEGGYIQLDQGQNELFQTDNKWKQVGRLTPTGQGQTLNFDFTYDKSAKRIDLMLPQNLQNEQIYHLEIVNVPAAAAGSVDENIREEAATRTQSGQEMTIKTKQAEGELQLLQEKVIYSSYFRTSRYNTFAEKLAALQEIGDWQWAIQTGVQDIGKTVSGAETFDKFEINGGKNAQPLIALSGKWGMPWHHEMDRLIYQNAAPYSPDFTIHWSGRPAHYSSRPQEAVRIDQNDMKQMLTDAAIDHGFAAGSSGRAAYVYQLPFYIYYDYYYLQQEAANSGIDSPEVRYLLSHPFVPIYAGQYPVYAGYRLPGSSQAHHFHPFIITKP